MKQSMIPLIDRPVIIRDDKEVLNKPGTVTEPMIILYNDDVNSFDTVIDALMKYCEHTEQQAHQCAMIVHNNGKIDVKRGTYNKLRPIYEALLDAGLSVKIEI